LIGDAAGQIQELAESIARDVLDLQTAVEGRTLVDVGDVVSVAAQLRGNMSSGDVARLRDLLWRGGDRVSFSIQAGSTCAVATGTKRPGSLRSPFPFTENRLLVPKKPVEEGNRASDSDSARKDCQRPVASRDVGQKPRDDGYDERCHQDQRSS
jgi:hypothetical protein